MKIEEHIAEIEAEMEATDKERFISVQTSTNRMQWLEQNKPTIPDWLYNDGMSSQQENINNDHWHNNYMQYLENQLRYWKNRQKAVQSRKADS